MAEVELLRTPRQLVTFRVGETTYGLDIDAVSEILPLLPVTAIGGGPRGILGMVQVRKLVVPVFDLHRKFGVDRPSDERGARLILVEVAAGPVAFRVDEVHEVLTVPRTAYQEVPAVGSDEGVAYLAGVVQVGAELVLWVDHHRLVPSSIVKRAVKKAA